MGRRTSKKEARAKKRAAKAAQMENPSGNSRYNQRPVDPHRSTANTVAIARYRRVLARSGIKADDCGNATEPKQATAPKSAAEPREER